MTPAQLGTTDAMAQSAKNTATTVFRAFVTLGKFGVRHTLVAPGDYSATEPAVDAGQVAKVIFVCRKALTGDAVHVTVGAAHQGEGLHHPEPLNRDPGSIANVQSTSVLDARPWRGGAPSRNEHDYMLFTKRDHYHR